MSFIKSNSLLDTACTQASSVFFLILTAWIHIVFFNDKVLVNVLSVFWRSLTTVAEQAEGDRKGCHRATV